MARNISPCGNVPGFRNPLAGKNGALKQYDTYVQIKMVPCDWFPHMVRKTKTQKKNSSPLFQESFEFNISSSDHSAKVGLLHFTLKTSQLLHADGFLGEVLIPLDTIQCVEFASAGTVKNKYLNVNVPKDESDYVAVKALKFRTWDKKAVTFLKELKELRRKTGNSS